jgi:signal peptidase II
MVWSIIIIILLAAADQLIKAVVKTNLSFTDSIPVIDGFFHLVNRQNPGAAWSFLANKEWGIYFLIAVSATVTVVMLFMIWRSRRVKLQVCLTLICAGSLGNLIDRIRDRAVTDYLDFHFGNYIFPTFNLADMLVVCGTILLGLLIFIDPTLIQSEKVHADKPGQPQPKTEKEAPHAADRPD